MIDKLLYVIVFLLVFGCKKSDELTTRETSVGVDEIVEPKVVLRLDFSNNNPRNSEGDFIKLKGGRLLYIYTHYFNGSGADHDPAFLASRYSDDNGETWSAIDEVVLENEAEQNIMSVSLLRLNNGDIALFYLRKNSLVDCIPYIRISKDEAKTWGEPTRCILDKEGYFTINNDRVIQLKSGRLLLPVAYFMNNTIDSFNSFGTLYCYYSDDNGLTWTSSEIVPNSNNVIVQEPGVIEKKDGSIVMFARSNVGTQQMSISWDEGQTWSDVHASEIVSPLSPATIEVDPESEHWIMIWNNNDGSNPEIEGKRTPLTVAISDDEGKSWQYHKDIETNPVGWYCYTAIYADQDNILLGYCSGIRDENTIGLEVTSVKKISKSWLLQEPN